jgi:hypothetical protein
MFKDVEADLYFTGEMSHVRGWTAVLAPTSNIH